jgi:hypothetical protein
VVRSFTPFVFFDSLGLTLPPTFRASSRASEWNLNPIGIVACRIYQIPHINERTVCINERKEREEKKRKRRHDLISERRRNKGQRGQGRELSHTFTLEEEPFAPNPDVEFEFDRAVRACSAVAGWCWEVLAPAAVDGGTADCILCERSRIRFGSLEFCD